ncbi:MAG: hypothetical protein V2A73_05205 [Pseudomonadota bacterium]
MKCENCGAPVSEPSDVAVLSIRCPFCGVEVAVPDAARRLEAQQRLALVDVDARRVDAEIEERRLEREERAAENRRTRRSWSLHRLFIALAVLVGPTIVVWQVFDLEGRYWGSTGKERVELVLSSLKTNGCTVLVPPTVRYLKNETLVEPLALDAGSCVKVLVAGGAGHKALELKLFDPSGALLETRPRGVDSQLARCVPASGVYSYHLATGLLEKGRATYAVARCPAFQRRDSR